MIPIAGDQITNDVAMALRTRPKAEDLKVAHGCALRQLADPNQMIEVPGVGDRGPRQMSRNPGGSDRATGGRAVFAGQAEAAPFRF